MGSAVGMILFSFPFYMAASHGSIIFTTIFQLILMLLLNVQFAILPCLAAELFPTTMRYTGIGMSYNLCDSIIGGITPLVALYLTRHVGDIVTFVLLITVSAIITAVTLFFIKERRLHLMNKVDN